MRVNSQGFNLQNGAITNAGWRIIDGLIVRSRVARLSLIVSVLMLVASCATNGPSTGDAVGIKDYLWSVALDDEFTNICFARDGSGVMLISETGSARKLDIFTRESETYPGSRTDCGGTQGDFQRFYFRSDGGSGYILRNPISVRGGKLANSHDGALYFQGDVSAGSTCRSEVTQECERSPKAGYIYLAGSDSIIVGPKDRFLITSGSMRWNPLLWILHSGQKMFLTGVESLKNFRSNSDGTYLYYVQKNGDLIVVDTETASVKKFKPGSRVKQAHVSSSYPLVATYSRNKTIKLWSLDDGPILAEYQADFGGEIHRGSSSPLNVQFGLLNPDGNSINVEMLLTIKDRSFRKLVEKTFRYENVREPGQYVFAHQIPVPGNVARGRYKFSTELKMNGRVIDKIDQFFIVK